ncbi:transcriptional regulator with XRE-family HTH domain [Pararhizobium capsulatum DSM 1112]|uniref:Transcriptional regulator with XRE-family HTH domain n=1 Tax=Pararhizobium capsulatum DSM 1112 TaxID=1121113 RepID=A0ABU0BMD6_9HYPH|nr:XRE family transcriptional regulator [Pararhizobium capsulatum]MDQ0318620.1 transcriptional regulator with XRE-family HTH domain [Pararhizobium capsulatum DSM 1112]
MPERAAERLKAADETQTDEDVIGSQIRELRKAKGMTLQEVADSAGISVGYLSQIERNQSKLPIGVLKKISTTLGVQINWFFHASDVPADEKDIIVRADNRRKLTFTKLGIQEELLSPNLSGPLEMLMSTIDVGADSGDYSHDGVEAGIVISGTLDLWVSGQHFTLNAGDSFSFKSTATHRCANPGNEPTKVVWIITPPQY